jgi:hypothetical protein
VIRVRPVGETQQAAPVDLRYPIRVDLSPAFTRTPQAASAGNLKVTNHRVMNKAFRVTPVGQISAMPGLPRASGRCLLSVPRMRKSRIPSVEYRSVPPVRIEEPIDVARAQAFNGFRSLRVEVLRDFSECRQRNRRGVDLHS